MPCCLLSSRKVLVASFCVFLYAQETVVISMTRRHKCDVCRVIASFVAIKIKWIPNVYGFSFLQRAPTADALLIYPQTKMKTLKQPLTEEKKQNNNNNKNSRLNANYDLVIKTFDVRVPFTE